ncbi:MAG: tRNA dihydrouridine(20/20a) synthase DusA [Gammaproteobacteria bacterium]|nr:tRNA dihydrouridine(20/20a) synthase DusA [Gammaproteobacteria bacterium]
MTHLDLRLSVAPMMDWTDSSCRYLLRLISQHTRLYTEMVPAQALWHAGAERFLKHHPTENPLALQLGGSEPKHLVHGAALAADWGYDEVNLNVGCPSDRVQAGRFGACLMKEPEYVAELVAAMRAACSLPVTVKSRIGVDEMDSYEAFHDFTENMVQAGAAALIVHARKAWLKGLSPKQNREVPPLRYDYVTAIKTAFPTLPVVLNGGIKTLAEATPWVEDLDGVMIGRAAYHDPWILADADAKVFGAPGATNVTRRSVSLAYREYVLETRQPDVPISRFTRHLIGLYQGQPGAKTWRRMLSEGAAHKGAGIEVIDRAIDWMDQLEAEELNAVSGRSVGDRLERLVP